MRTRSCFVFPTTSITCNGCAQLFLISTLARSEKMRISGCSPMRRWQRPGLARRADATVQARSRCAPDYGETNPASLVKFRDSNAGRKTSLIDSRPTTTPRTIGWRDVACYHLCAAKLTRSSQPGQRLPMTAYRRLRPIAALNCGSQTADAR
jgi:hypothetical protein